MYRDYWKLARNPFDNVPDPGMYFRMHSTVESTVAELMFAIEEGNECLAVVVGEVGLGKTMALRVTLDSLEAEKYKIAFVTNPDLTFPQLLREIVGQLKGEPCSIARKEILLEEFNKIIFESADQDKKVLIFIDEGNVLTGPNLERLRLLTNMQEDTRNLFTIIIAGQPKLGKMLRDKRRANLLQRVGVLCQLEPLNSAQLVRDYVEHRLELVGSKDPIFTDAAYQKIFEFSGGIPRLINKICKLCLKAGETNALDQVNADIVFNVALRFEWEWPKNRKTGSAAPTVEDARPAEDVTPAAEAKTDITVVPEAETSNDSAVIHSYDGLGPDPSEPLVTEERELVGVAQAVGASPAEASAEAVGGDCEQSVSANAEDTLQLEPEVLDQLTKITDKREREQFAGRVAANQLHQYPEHYSLVKDPVDRWRQLRHEILARVPQ